MQEWEEGRDGVGGVELLRLWGTMQQRHMRAMKVTRNKGRRLALA